MLRVRKETTNRTWWEFYIFFFDAFQMKIAYFIQDDFSFSELQIHLGFEKMKLRLSYILNHGYDLNLYDWKVTSHLVDYVKKRINSSLAISHLY
jgi:hypothetical protein